MMASLHARLTDPEKLPGVLRALDEAGIGRESIEVRTSAPLPEHLLPGIRLHSMALPAAILGALVGGTSAYLLATLTAKAYPMITGGMKIVALPPVGIVTYEGTAFGLIVATVALVLIEGRVLFRRAPHSPFAQHLAAGDVVLALETDDDGVARIEEIVRGTGVDETSRTS